MRLIAVIGFIVAAALGLYVYSWQFQQMATSAGGSSPQGIIDTVGIKTDLVAFAEAERQQYALEGTYLSLDDLRGKGIRLPAGRRGPYVFSAEVTPTTFVIKAAYRAPQGAKPMPTLTIGPDMEVKPEEGSDR